MSVFEEQNTPVSNPRSFIAEWPWENCLTILNFFFYFFLQINFNKSNSENYYEY